MNTTRKHLQPLVVLAGGRTPFYKAFTKGKEISADRLASELLRAVITRSGLNATHVDEVIFGNVATPAHAANIARVIAMEAGIPQRHPAHTVSRNCASGMESIVGAWHAIAEGRAEVVAAGGVESMSNIPLQFSADFQRWMMDWRRKKGFAKLKHLADLSPDLLKPVSALEIGLSDPICGLSMGETAELLAKEFDISRAEQDEFALRSHQRAAEAWKRCFMSGEVLTDTYDKNVENVQPLDNGIRPQQSFEALAKLKPVFDRSGTVTAGNSSQLTDGASCLIVSGVAPGLVPDLVPLGKIEAYTVTGCDPKRMGLGPVFAISKILQLTNRSLSDFDLFEINEAFAAQVLACLKAMNSADFCRTHLERAEPIGEIPIDKLNVNGGAIALGHPLGASANRLILTLLRALKETGGKRGLAALCVGGGQGMAMTVSLEE